MSILEKVVEFQSATKALRRWDERAFTVVNRVRSQACLEDALQILVTDITRELQADRCFILDFDDEQNSLPISIEARSSAKVASFRGMTLPWQSCPYLNSRFRKQLNWASDIWENPSVELGETLVNFVREHTIHGLIISPIVYEDEILCVLVVQTSVPRNWEEGELLFIQISSDQAALSVFQARASRLYKQLLESESRYHNLYQWEKKTREVFQAIRQPLDTPTLYPMAIREMAQALLVDRAFIIEFDDEGRVFPIRYQYRRNDTVESFIGMVPPWETCPYLTQTARHEMASTNDTLQDQLLEHHEPWAEFFRQANIRGFAAAPILYNEQLMSVVVFHTVDPHVWTEQELFFIKVITEQLSTVFFQEKLRTELVQAAQVKSDFLSKMSHELRTPLNAILGYTQMLELGMAGALTGKQTEYLRYASSSAEHLLGLVNDILDFSKVQAGKMTIAPEPVTVSFLVDEVKGMMEGLAEQKGIQLVFDIHPELKVIEADPARFKQILINLISNAIKFNRRQGKVFVSLFRSQNQPWCVGRVRDTGIGISREKLPELFTKFHQIDNSISRLHDGTGLGLVLTKELIELHGGEITVSSEEGVGSTFTFKLPMAS